MLREPDTTVTWMRRIALRRGAAGLRRRGPRRLRAADRRRVWAARTGRAVMDISHPPAPRPASPPAPPTGCDPAERGRAWREMIHRYFAGSLVVLTLILAVLAFVQKRPRARRERRACRSRSRWSRTILDPGAARHAHRDLAGRAADRDAAPAVRHDHAGAAVVAVADAGCAHPAHRVPALGRSPGGALGAVEPHQPPAGALGLVALAAADRAGRLDQHQLRGHRLPGFSDLPGLLVAAHGLRSAPSCCGMRRP